MRNQIFLPLILLILTTCSSQTTENPTRLSDSVAVEYFSNGDTAKVISFRDDRKERLEVYHYITDSSGNKMPGRIFVPFVNDSVEGTVKHYYNTGSLYISASFYKGMQHGKKEIFDIDGAKILERFYRNDSLLYEKNFVGGELIETFIKPLLLSKDTICLGEEYVGRYKLPIEFVSEVVLALGQRMEDYSRLKDGFIIVKPNQNGIYEYRVTPCKEGMNKVDGIFIHRNQELDTLSVHGTGFTDAFIVNKRCM